MNLSPDAAALRCVPSLARRGAAHPGSERLQQALCSCRKAAPCTRALQSHACALL